jgi:hypothetical protein
VGCNAIAAVRDRKLGCAHRIGMASAARIADSGNVIDVHTKAKPFHAFSLRTIFVRNRSPIFGIMR